MKIGLPWEARVMMESPWLMQAAMLAAALLLSLLTWLREKKHRSDQ